VLEGGDFLFVAEDAPEFVDAFQQADAIETVG
jgi:hypothetical protein